MTSRKIPTDEVGIDVRMAAWEDCVESGSVPMSDAEKTKEQLIEELESLRALVAEKAAQAPDATGLLSPLTQAFDRSSVGFALYDSALRYLFINELLAAEHGIPAAEHIGFRVDEIMPELGAQVAPLLRRVRETREPALMVEFASKVHASSGDLKHWLVDYVPVRLQGDAVGVGAFVQNITKLKLSEQALRESEQRYSALFANKINPMAHCEVITDEGNLPVDYRILRINEAYERVIGVKKADIEGRTVREVFPGVETFSFDFIGTLGMIGRDGGEANFEAFLESTNQYLSVYAYSPLPGEFTTIFTDITERRLAEEAMRASEERLRVISENIYDWEYWRAPDGRYLWVSPSCETISGYAPQRFLGKPEDPIGKIVHPDDRRTWAEHLQEMDSRHPEHAELDIRLVRPDGRVVWISHTCKPIFGPDGACLGRQGCNRDITERKLAEEALQESEQRYKSFFMASIDAVLLTAPEGKIYAANKAAQVMFGRSEEELCRIGRNGLVDLSDTRLPILVEQRRRSGFSKGELRLLHKNGSTFPGEVSSAIFTDTNGRPRTCMIIRDMTERKKGEEALILAKEQALAANLAKSSFLANMSHEIRTPLNGVMGMLQLLETTDQTEEQKEYIRTAIRSSKRLTSLLSDILDLSRIEAGKMPLQEARFEMICLKEAVTDLFGMEAKSKGLSLEFDLDERLLGVFLGDEVRVRQILLNLVGNAIKFTRQGGVTVEAVALSRLSDQLQHVLFIVHDTGPGITDDQLATIFEPFVQGEESYVRRHQGAGLGLSIVIRLVRLMGGEISIESERGCGTSMYVSIPFRLPSRLATLPAPMPHPLPARDTGALRILLAEDDAVTRVAIKKLLEKTGHHVAVAVDGADALQTLEKGVFDVILMDIQMPEMDGLQATRAIRFKDRFEAVREIPIIALTAYAMAGDKEKFLGVGMDDYISKPVDIEALKGVLAHVMSKHGGDG